MPSMGTYELKICGMLKGSVQDNQQGIHFFRDVFPDHAPGGDADKDGSWPSGLVWPGYDVDWKVSVEEEPTERIGADQHWGTGRNTRLTFRYEGVQTWQGTLFDNKDTMLPHVDWFYHYCQKKWQQTLSAQIKDLNVKLQATGNLLIPVEFRDWKWYCGNGGGT